MDSYVNDPRVQKLASAGLPWAVKLSKKGWASLTTAQKRTARAALGIMPVAAVVVPSRPRVRNPPNPGSRSGPGTAGKTHTVTRREYVTDIGKTEGATPSFASWVLNPASVRSFPCASVCALQYNKYKFTRLVVHYSSTSSFEVNGAVVVGYNSDSSDAVPTNKSQLSEFKWCMSAAARESKSLNIPTDNTFRYLRDSSADDAKLVDFGRLVLATYGFDSSAPATVGELHIEYTIVFSDPTYTSALTQVGMMDSSVGPQYAVATASASSFTLSLEAAGKWLVVMQNEAVFNKPEISGSGASGTVWYGDGTLATITLESNLPGTIISIATTSTISGQRWFVSRL